MSLSSITANPTVVAAATQSASAASSTKTVIIGCKMPHGIVMELGIGVKANGEPVNEPYESFVIKGSNTARIMGGFGITYGVPADFAAKWFKRNAQLRYVKEGLVFTVEDKASAKDVAKERKGLKTKLEAIDPMAPPKGSMLVVDEAAKKAYENQKSQNPSNGKQVDELEKD